MVSVVKLSVAEGLAMMLDLWVEGAKQEWEAEKEEEEEEEWEMQQDE